MKDWRVDIFAWQDGYGWRVTHLLSGYTYSSVMYDSEIGAKYMALWHIVDYQAEQLRRQAVEV